MSHGSAALTREKIAHARMTKHEARISLRALYDTARNVYVHSSTLIVQHLDDAANLRVVLDQAEANMQGVEAGWVQAGLFKDFTNEMQRKAQREILRGEDEQYLDLAATATNTKQTIVRTEGQIEAIKMDMRLARFDMECAIAEIRCLAGEDEPHYER